MKIYTEGVWITTGGNRVCISAVLKGSLNGEISYYKSTEDKNMTWNLQGKCYVRQNPTDFWWNRDSSNDLMIWEGFEKIPSRRIINPILSLELE
jgi:hypothetical protein